MTVFLLRRRLRIGDQDVLVPVGVYSRKEDAADVAGKLHMAQASLLDCLIVRPGREGEAEDTGVRVGRFLADIGVVGFKPEIVEVEVEGAMIQVATEMPRRIVQ